MLLPSRLVLCGISILGASFASEFPAPFNSGGNPATPPMSAAAAVAAITLPPGFKATVFASEPDVQNPIAMTWDSRGRIWVAENYTYAERTLKFDLRLRDRVLVFEDRNGDGHFSSRRVFFDDVQRLTSVEVGAGGVWLMAPPQLLFVPDRDGDGVADGPAEVVLDGFNLPSENYHNFANGLRFGPDGWLYGRCGASCPGEIGAPGTPNDARIPLRGTIWRYHPVHKTFEVLSGGTTNPWGHDWDEYGELFFINTVNGFLWHGITGAHYARAHTLDPNPHVYELIDTHADHWHFDTAQDWTKSRDGVANAYGGGHAHIGMMIYQGDNWPVAYRNKLYTLNYHGKRTNVENLVRTGSGYVGKHDGDIFLASDPWFRGMELSSGPDGGVFVLDWSDTGDCHNANGVSRTSGRIYKITYGDAKAHGPPDLDQVGGRDLAALQTHANVWYARQARLELMARALDGHKLTHGIEDLKTMFAEQKDPVVKLRALWTLYSIGAAEPAFLRAQLRHENEHIRTWAIRLLTDRWPLDTTLSQRPRASGVAPDPGLLKDLVALAKSELSALVRLALVSCLQRLEPAQRAELATALVAHAEDANDHNLPLMIWYGLIPVGDVAPRTLAEIGARCELPITRRLMARRLAEDLEKTPTAMNALLEVARAKSAEFQADVITGLSEGVRGWHRATKPAAWDALVAAISPSAPTALTERVRDLNVLFGDGRALDDVKALALNGRAELPARMAALQSLVASRPPDLRKTCEQLLRVRFLNAIAARGLALFDDPVIGQELASAYSSFHPSERPALIETLVSRPAFARALLAHVASGRIPRGDITPFHARQMRSFGDPELNDQLALAWGELRAENADKRALIAKLRAELTPTALAAANKSQGRAIFAATCAVCHRLYGEGGAIGPDLTGAGRDNLDYLLENIADPSAVVTADFRMSVVKLKDGRTLNGFISARTTRTLTVRSMTDTQTVEREDVSVLEESKQSMMPEGLLEALTPTQRRDLIAYLMHPTQVPLP